MRARVNHFLGRVFILMHSRISTLKFSLILIATFFCFDSVKAQQTPVYCTFVKHQFRKTTDVDYWNFFKEKYKKRTNGLKESRIRGVISKSFAEFSASESGGLLYKRGDMEFSKHFRQVVSGLWMDSLKEPFYEVESSGETTLCYANHKFRWYDEKAGIFRYVMKYCYKSDSLIDSVTSVKLWDTNYNLSVKFYGYWLNGKEIKGISTNADYEVKMLCKGERDE